MPVTRSDSHLELLWVLNSLMEIKASADETGGTLTVIEQVVSPAGNTPLHVHRDEDESFVVLEGELEVTLGDQRVRVGPGQFVFGPRGVAHGYQVLSPQARVLVLATPGGLERFFRAAGRPAASRTLPEPQAPDVDELLPVAAAHGIAVLPPPPL